jgi:putative hydrolase of the HAD superfamily
MQQPVTSVIFDYGGVLSLPVAPDSLRILADLTGLAPDRFAAEHMRERLAYDRADIGLERYWSRFLALSGRTADPALLERLNREDLRGWSRINDRVLDWSRRLRAAGCRTAILSNMPQPLLDLMNADPAFAWLAEFPVRVFSCEERLVKPEPGIYRAVLDRLGARAGSCVFLDDSGHNVEGARGAGIRALHFRSAAEAAAELASLGLPVAGLVDGEVGA